jgi:hypothetical protein
VLEIGLWQQVSAAGEQLAQFDERRPQPFQIIRKFFGVGRGVPIERVGNVTLGEFGGHRRLSILQKEQDQILVSLQIMGGKLHILLLYILFNLKRRPTDSRGMNSAKQQEKIGDICDAARVPAFISDVILKAA